MDDADSKNPKQTTQKYPSKQTRFSVLQQYFKKRPSQIFLVTQAQSMKFCRYIFIRCWGAANLVLYFK